MLPDGSVEVYELNDQGEVVGTIPADQLDDASGASLPDDGSSTGSDTGGDPTSDPGSASGPDGSSSGDAPAASDDPTAEPGAAADGQSAAPAPEPAPEPEPVPQPEPEPVVTAPTVAVSTQKCNGANLLVSLTASAGNGYRKGIKSVTVARQNEYDVFLTSNAGWLGPETGAGNVWNGTLGGNRQNIGKTLRVTATSDAGQSTTVEVPITAPC